MIEAMICDKMI